MWVLELSCHCDRSIRFYGRACTHACIDRCLHHVVGSQIELRFCPQSCSPTHTSTCTLSIHLSLRQPPPLVLTDVTLSTPICVCTITVTEAWGGPCSAVYFVRHRRWCVGRLQVAGVTVILSRMRALIRLICFESGSCLWPSLFLACLQADGFLSKSQILNLNEFSIAHLNCESSHSIPARCTTKMDSQ